MMERTLARQEIPSSSTSVREADSQYEWKGPFKDPRRFQGKPRPAKKDLPERKGPKSHVQDDAQNRRDLNRAEKLISSLKAKVAELEAEIYKRDLVAQASFLIGALQKQHMDEVTKMKAQLQHQEMQLEASNKHLHALSKDTTNKSREHEQAMLFALQEHKRLQDEAKVSSTKALSEMEAKMRHWLQSAWDKDKELDTTQKEVAKLQKSLKAKDRGNLPASVSLCFQTSTRSEEDQDQRISELEDKFHKMATDKDSLRNDTSNLFAIGFWLPGQIGKADHSHGEGADCPGQEGA